MFNSFNILDTDINLNLYKTFYIVATSKSYSDASLKLHKSVPAISTNIKDLEGMLNVILFERKSNGVTLTASGEELYKYLDRAFSEISKGQKIVMKKNDLATGELIIGCPSHIATNYLMNYIEQAQIDYPELKVQLLSGLNARELLLELKEHRIDFVIDSTQIETLDDDIIKDEIKMIPNIFVSNYPLKIEDIKELEKQKCILPFENTSTTKNLIKTLKEYDVSIDVNMQIDITEVRIDAVKRGFGIGYVMKDIVERQLQSEELFEVEMPIELPSSRLNLIYLKEYLTRADKKFIKQYLDMKIKTL